MLTKYRQSRRERGKLAQREYRKRHANKFQTLQEDNKRLRDAIAAISDAVKVRGRPWAELETAIAEAREAAELEPLDFEDSPAASATTSVTNGGSSFTTGPTLYSPPQVPEYSPASVPVRHGTSDPVALVQPDSPGPYLDDGLSTLAGLISWACTTYTVTLWRQIQRGGATTQFEDFMDEHMFGTLRVMTDQAYLASLARSRLTNRTVKGCVFRRLGGLADVEALRERYRKLTSASAAAERERQLGPLANPDLWRSPRDVEEHIRAQSTPEEFERIQAVVQGRATDYDVLCVGRFVVSLCGNFVCSPGGPRWHTMFATMGVGLMLRRLRGETVADIMAPPPSN